MNDHKIKTFHSLLHLVALDETDHTLKDMATLLVSALRDWGNCQDIDSCVADFKAYFGDPLTVENTAHYNGQDTEDWAWRAEAGAALSKMMQRSIAAYQIADFDTIVERLLSHYEQELLLNSKGKIMNDPEIIIGQAYVYFAIRSNTLSQADCTQWLGKEPVATTGITSIFRAREEDWKISTPMTDDPYLYPMIRGIVDLLIPIKDRLIALKKAHPEIHYVLEVVLYQGHGTAGLSLDNDTLLFLAEIGAILDCDMYRQ